MKINVAVTANAKATNIIKIDEFNYKVKINAPAKEGKANERLIEFLSEYFNKNKSKIKIIKGLKSRSKTIEIED
ncbi:MAG: DUF167 domain-containing protein [Candidatus Micrarchaeia archaeon]